MIHRLINKPVTERLIFLSFLNRALQRLITMILVLLLLDHCCIWLFLVFTLLAFSRLEQFLSILLSFFLESDVILVKQEEVVSLAFGILDIK